MDIQPIDGYQVTHTAPPARRQRLITVDQKAETATPDGKNKKLLRVMFILAGIFGVALVVGSTALELVAMSYGSYLQRFWNITVVFKILILTAGILSIMSGCIDNKRVGATHLLLSGVNVSVFCPVQVVLATVAWHLDIHHTEQIDMYSHYFSISFLCACVAMLICNYFGWILGCVEICGSMLGIPPETPTTFMYLHEMNQHVADVREQRKNPSPSLNDPVAFLNTEPATVEISDKMPIICNV